MPQNDHTHFIGGHLTMHSKLLELQTLKMIRIAIFSEECEMSSFSWIFSYWSKGKFMHVNPNSAYN